MEEVIGATIKKIRLAQNLTLQAVSETTDLSVGYLSLLERGLTSPTISNLQKVCKALNITMSSLLSSTEKSPLLVKEKDRELIYDDHDGVFYEATTSGDRNLSGVCMTITDMKLHISDVHIADEVGTIISGSATFILNDEEVYELSEGDTLYIPAYTKHSFQKTSRKDCVSLWIYSSAKKYESEQYTNSIFNMTKGEPT